MNSYRFALQNRDTAIEELGVMALPNDDEAHDLADDPGQQAGAAVAAVAVIKGTRTVRCIPLK